MDQCIKMYELHVGAKHAVDKATAPGPSGAGAVKNEERKKTERAKIKPPTFRESEVREDYERKRQDFEIYSKWAKLTSTEKSEDLYLACDTPLRKKVRASGILKEELGETEFAALSAEMERLCAPRGNRHVERDEFKNLTQGDEELITAFESRLRLKAKQCDFYACGDNCKELCMMKLECGYDINQDEIITQLVTGMRDKDLQRQLWAENKHLQDLPTILAKIKSHEVADSRQAASNSESGSFVIKLKCHKCGKVGHAQRNCKAGNIKCNTCNLFGHYSSCCTDFTKSRARKTRDVSAVSTVEVSGEESNTVRLSNVSQEKISSGTQEEVSNTELSNVSQEKISNRSQGEGGDNRAAIHVPGRDDVISEDVNNTKIEENEATNTHV